MLLEPIYNGIDITSASVFIEGNAVCGQTLKAIVQKINPNDATYTYQWYQNGIAINDAIFNSYTVTKEDINKSISVKIFGIGNFICSIESDEVFIRKSVSDISINTLPRKLTYIEGTELDTTGMEITLIYDNDTTETIISGWIENYDFSTPGTKTVTITYNGKTASFDVNVVTKSLSLIEVTKKPSKLTYAEIERSRGFADAAFLVGNGNHFAFAHFGFLLS